MQHFVAEMCTHGIMGCETGALWHLCNRSYRTKQNAALDMHYWKLNGVQVLPVVYKICIFAKNIWFILAEWLIFVSENKRVIKMMACCLFSTKALSEPKGQCRWVSARKMYRKLSNIRRTKFQNFNDSRLVLQLFLSYPLKPGVKSRMKL